LKPIVIGAIFVILVSALSSHADIYEWVDENGTVTFKDTPPLTSKRNNIKVYSDVELERTLPPQKVNPYKHQHSDSDKDTLIPIIAFANDSEIAIFDDVQSSFVKMYENIGKICEESVPECTKHYKELTKLQIMTNKLERIIFIHMLNNESTSERMTYWSDWLYPSISIVYSKVEKIIKLHPEYDELFKATKKQEYYVRMINSGNDELTKRKGDAVEKIKDDFFREQGSFKKRWDAIKIKVNKAN